MRGSEITMWFWRLWVPLQAHVPDWLQEYILWIDLYEWSIFKIHDSGKENWCKLFFEGSGTPWNKGDMRYMWGRSYMQGEVDCLLFCQPRLQMTTGNELRIFYYKFRHRFCLSHLGICLFYSANSKDFTLFYQNKSFNHSNCELRYQKATNWMPKGNFTLAELSYL